mmetsp:Transcript_13398/g.11478  ORF Transcript_13398/g.11478 Transcript_13398/m.11478 type:complete len:87 (+) Transcript_13398:595-855(+)
MMIRNPNITRKDGEQVDLRNMTIMDKIKNKYKNAKPKSVKKKYCPPKLNENSINKEHGAAEEGKESEIDATRGNDGYNSHHTSHHH